MREHIFQQVQQSKGKLTIIRMQSVMLIMTVCNGLISPQRAGLYEEQAIYLRQQCSHVRGGYTEAA